MTMFTKQVLESIDNSVLCWLATSDESGAPNVSPKEVFAAHGDNVLAIANIASPQSAKNVRGNAKVCVAFVDILVQKGFQVFGEAVIVRKTDSEFEALAAPLMQITQGKFPFATLFKISVSRVKPIISPRYVLYPETTESAQIASALETYRIDEICQKLKKRG